MKISYEVTMKRGSDTVIITEFEDGSYEVEVHDFEKDMYYEPDFLFLHVDIYRHEGYTALNYPDC